MELPKTWVGFSSKDAGHFETMLSWRAGESHEFNFETTFLHRQPDRNDRAFVLEYSAGLIEPGSRYVILINRDTRQSCKYVQYEAEVAVERKCTIIGVNLDGSRKMVRATCPPIIRDVGAVFVSFSPNDIAHAIRSYKMIAAGHYYYPDMLYEELEFSQQD